MGFKIVKLLYQQDILL